jgi:hypothetical protein
VTGEEVAELVREHGPEEVGRRYLRTDPNDADSWWVREAVWFGTGIDEETHLELILAALRTTMSIGASATSPSRRVLRRGLG